MNRYAVKQSRGLDGPFIFTSSSCAIHARIQAAGNTMRTNSFAAPVVKIQKDRGQTVITTGPYAIIRHPMYFGALFYFGEHLACAVVQQAELLPLYIEHNLRCPPVVRIALGAGPLTLLHKLIGISRNR